jgi:hypothetical protein
MGTIAIHSRTRVRLPPSPLPADQDLSLSNVNQARCWSIHWMNVQDKMGPATSNTSLVSSSGACDTLSFPYLNMVVVPKYRAIHKWSWPQSHFSGQRHLSLDELDALHTNDALCPLIRRWTSCFVHAIQVFAQKFGCWSALQLSPRQARLSIF